MAFQYGAPNYGYAPQQTYFPQQQVNPAYSCHPVGSREEAVAAQTDYFSAGLVMPDLSHGVIYLKRFNQQTGASDFFEFRLAQAEPKEESKPQYVTVEEFEKFQKELSRRFKVKEDVADE